MNENKANYAKIGFFVLSGFALILIAIGIAGARVFNKKVVLAETYFTESVTGLDVGSPVKYRGVPVGEVSRIGFAFSEYGNSSPEQMTLAGANQILVVMALDPNKFTPLQNHSSAAFLERLVKDGMRVKLAAAGVTGLSFLELDYFRSNPLSESPLSLNWHPKNTYIPSSPSTMFSFKKAFDDVFIKLSNLNFQGLGDEWLNTLHLTQRKMKDLDVVAISAEATALLAELRETNRGIKKFVSAPEIAQIPVDLGAAAGSTRRITASVETQLPALLQSFQKMSDQANFLAETLNSIATNASVEVGQTVSAINQTAQTLNRTTLSQQDALAELIQNLRSASTGLNQIISDLRANPSALLFSKPPEPLPETRGIP